MTDFKECRFCHGGETRIEESAHWTGMRYQVLSVTLRHFCKDFSEDKFNTVMTTIRSRTEKEAREIWDKMND